MIECLTIIVIDRIVIKDERIVLNLISRITSSLIMITIISSLTVSCAVIDIKLDR